MFQPIFCYNYPISIYPTMRIVQFCNSEMSSLFSEENPTKHLEPVVHFPSNRQQYFNRNIFHFQVKTKRRHYICRYIDTAINKIPANRRFAIFVRGFGNRFRRIAELQTDEEFHQHTGYPYC